MSRSSPPRSSIAEKASDAGASSVGRHPGPARPLGRRIAIRAAAAIRWLHIYLSMFGLAVTLFFSVTGLTLNHPDWFGEPERRVTTKGRMAPEWLRPAASPAEGAEGVARLEVVEALRKDQGVRGAVAEFRVEDRECNVTFKGPGYAADVSIDRDSGRYELTQTIHGFIAVINDLHKGRDTGPAWSAVIDASAIILTAISATGLALLFYLKRKRIPGLLVVAAGTVAVVAIISLAVP